MPDDGTETHVSTNRRAFMSAVAVGGAGLVASPASGSDAAPVDERPAPVRLTPRPEEDTTSLAGTWDFGVADAESSTPPDEWDSIPVPAEWTHEGFDVERNERGWYRREFDVPADWEGRRLKLQFGAVYSHAEVWVNGERVGEHAGGYTPFEFDTTELIDAGEANEVTVAVEEETIADDMAWGTGRGGVTRDVTLSAVPDCHLASHHVETTLDDDEGTVRVVARIANESGEARTPTYTATLTEPDGSSTVTVEASIDPVEPDEVRTEVFEIEVTDPEPWDPVHPNLYDLDGELSTEAGSHAVSQRVGIREVTVDGNELLINGESVTLRGVNWEEVHPDHGQSVPSEITRSDVEQLREANINFLRTAHHPPSEALLDACDELGLIVEVEAPIFHLWEEPYDDDIIYQQTVEMVERDRSRPSVVLWSMGNEGWPADIDGHIDAAADVTAMDPTRPIIYHDDQYWEGQVGGLNLGVDLANHHYPATRPGYGIEAFEDLDVPILFGEFGHTYCYNGSELTTDPGLRDDWVRVFAETWDQVREVDACVGAAIWAGGDQPQPDRWEEDGEIVEPDEYRWGLLDRYRRPRPELWHVKKSYAPVTVSNAERTDEELTITVENHCEFANLAEHELTWEDTDGDYGALSPDVPPGETETVTVPTTGPVVLTITDRRGFTVDEVVVDADGEDDHTDLPERERTTGSVRETPHGIRVSSRGLHAEIDSDTGDVEVGRDRGHPGIVGRVDLALTPSQPGTSPPEYADALSHRPDGRQVDDVHLTDDDRIEIDLSYDVAEGTVALIPRDGALDVEYAFTLTQDVDAREAGIVVPVADGYETLSWERDAEWTTYPDDHVGRATGTATAFPGDERPTDDVARLDPNRSWAADATKHGSNDFRSTKRNARHATLSRERNRAVEVTADEPKSVRCQVHDDGIDTLVLDRTIGGVGLDFLDRLMLLEESTTLDTGTTIAGTVRLVPKRANE